MNPVESAAKRSVRSLCRWHASILSVLGPLLCAFAALNLYRLQAVAALPQGYSVMHREILEHVAPSPYRYRVLVPHCAELVRKWLPSLKLSTDPVVSAYLAVIGLGLLFYFFMLRKYMARRFGPRLALFSLLLVFGLLPISFRDHYFQPWSLWEPGFVILALMALERRSWVGFLVVVALSTLNRETGIYLAFFPLAFFPREPKSGRLWDMRPNRRGLCWILSAIMVWLLVYGALRLGLGHGSHVATPGWFLERNMTVSGLISTFSNVLFFLGPLSLLLLGFGGSDRPDYRRQALLGLLYIPMVLVVALWWEVRVFIPVYALILPLALDRLRALLAIASAHEPENA